MIPFLGSSEAALSSALLHNLACALILLVYMGVRGRLRDTFAAIKTNSGKAVMGAAVLGGPIGMSGYLIAINNIGPGYTAIISTFYPAVGTLLAYVFLKERMHLKQIVALLVALGGVILMGWSSMTAEVPGNAAIGIGAALLCVVGWGSEAVILAWGMRDEAVDNEALQIRETTSALVYLVVVGPIFGVVGFSLNAMPTPAAGSSSSQPSPERRRTSTTTRRSTRLEPLARNGAEHLVLSLGRDLRAHPPPDDPKSARDLLLRRHPRRDRACGIAKLVRAQLQEDHRREVRMYTVLTDLD